MQRRHPGATFGAMTTRTDSRTVEGRVVPAPGRYVIDSAHSSIQVTARHLVISKVRGQFKVFTGAIVIAEEPTESWVEMVVQASSIDTGDAERDEHLRSADFLDVEHHPEIRFRSTHVDARPNGAWQVGGDLTIRDRSRPVVMDVEYTGIATDPWDNVRIAFLATGEVDREEFDITWNQALEAGGVLVGRSLRFECDVEAVLAEARVDG
jgi:polyisoprenoid-binding protein YceI